MEQGTEGCAHAITIIADRTAKVFGAEAHKEKTDKNGWLAGQKRTKTDKNGQKRLVGRTKTDKNGQKRLVGRTKTDKNGQKRLVGRRHPRQTVAKRG